MQQLDVLTIFESLNGARLIWFHCTIVVHCTEITCVCCVGCETIVLYPGLSSNDGPIQRWTRICPAGICLAGVSLAG